MIVFRTWIKKSCYLDGYGYRKEYKCEGYFFLGFIPIYIKKIMTKDV